MSVTGSAVTIYRSDALVRVPRHERYATHKLIVTERRHDGPDSLKAAKVRGEATELPAIARSLSFRLPSSVGATSSTSERP